MLPHAFLTAWAIVAAVSPWVNWSNRFSLRTLLIAATLIAVGLAAIIYASR